jgi:hypothetical protein
MNCALGLLGVVGEVIAGVGMQAAKRSGVSAEFFRDSRLQGVVLGALAAILLSVGCVSDPERSRARGPGAPVVNACPLGVAFTRIAIADTPLGVDVIFETREDSVADLRRRVRDQAERHGPGARLGQGHAGQHGLSHDHGMRLWELPASSVTVVDVERGAKMSLGPLERTTRDELRARVIRRVALLEAQGCQD